MVTALMILLGAIALQRAAPALPLSRVLNEWLARRPAAWLLRRTRRELIAWAIVAAMFAFAGEYVLALGGPQLALAFAVDLAGYVDAAIAVAALASVARLKIAAQWLARVDKAADRRLPRPRAPRRARTRSASNDDADRPDTIIAA